MAVKVLTFGQLAEITGGNSLSVDNIKDTDELVRHLHSKYPALAKLNYIIAVDRQVITSNTSLEPENTVALMPPYAGG